MDAPPATEPSRRDFLGTAACVAATGCVGACAAVPVGAYLVPPAERGASGPIQVARSTEIAEGAAKAVKVGAINVLIIRTGGKLVAVNPKCTHLGCLVKWESKTLKIKCPCHSATFEADGTKPTTPADRPLPSFPVTEADNKVVVTF